MEPQKSLIIPVALTVLISAIIFGGLGWYAGNSQLSSAGTQLTATPVAQVSATPTAKTTPTPTASTTTTPDPTADWKTYVDSTTGLSFKYPQQLTEKDVTTSIKYSKSIAFLSGRTDSDSLHYLVEDRLFKKENINGVYFSNGEEVKSTTVAGRTAYYYAEGDAGVSSTTYAISSKDSTKIVRFVITTDETSTNKIVTPAIQAILATIKYSE